MAKRSIVWFKTDLRLHDQEPLVRAIERSSELIPVYCLDEAHFQTTEWGFRKTGSFRAQFLLESLADLDANLRRLGSGLLVVRGKPEVELYKVAREYGAKKIFAKKEVAYEEFQTEEAVEKALWKLSCTLEKYSSSTLYHPGDLPFALKDIPEVFSSFRQKIEKEVAVRAVFPRPEAISSPPIPPLELPSPEALGVPSVAPDSRGALAFRGGETAALERMRFYFEDTQAIASYKETRNGMIGQGYSTKLSPWLAMGSLSPRGVYHALKAYEEKFSANKSTYWLEYELLWRDYFRFMMKKHRRRFFLESGIKRTTSELPPFTREQLDKWVNGQTGNEFIDANMLELQKTGYMSNRGRQNVASYLINDMEIEWRYGAAYFEQQLIDYDVCSNWGNWAYLAGVGNDPRGKRYFHTEKQAAEYDPDRRFRELWLGAP